MHTIRTMTVMGIVIAVVLTTIVLAVAPYALCLWVLVRSILQTFS